MPADHTAWTGGDGSVPSLDPSGTERAAPRAQESAKSHRAALAHWRSLDTARPFRASGRPRWHGIGSLLCHGVIQAVRRRQQPQPNHRTKRAFRPSRSVLNGRLQADRGRLRALSVAIRRQGPGSRKTAGALESDFDNTGSSRPAPVRCRSARPYALASHRQRRSTPRCANSEVAGIVIWRATQYPVI